MGPVAREQLRDDTRDNEEDETILENWSFGEDSFKTFVSTTPVSNKNDHRNISDDIFTPKIACRTRKKVICLLQYKQKLFLNI